MPALLWRGLPHMALPHQAAPSRTLALDRAAISSFCRRHHIRRLALFGSVLRDDFGPESDVDVLVDFEPGHTPGLAFFAMQDELSQLLGRRVDLNTAADLSPHFRDATLPAASVEYAA